MEGGAGFRVAEEKPCPTRQLYSEATGRERLGDPGRCSSSGRDPGAAIEVWKGGVVDAGGAHVADEDAR